MDRADRRRRTGSNRRPKETEGRTGEIIEVEPGEAEWNLNILEQLFDFYLVQPEISRKRKENLNKKLEDAGKPQME